MIWQKVEVLSYEQKQFTGKDGKVVDWKTALCRLSTGEIARFSTKISLIDFVNKVVDFDMGIRLDKFLNPKLFIEGIAKK
jgi:hypothetical protein